MQDTPQISNMVYGSSSGSIGAGNSVLVPEKRSWCGNQVEQLIRRHHINQNTDQQHQLENDHKILAQTIADELIGRGLIAAIDGADVVNLITDILNRRENK